MFVTFAVRHFSVLFFIIIVVVAIERMAELCEHPFLDLILRSFESVQPFHHIGGDLGTSFTTDFVFFIHVRYRAAP